jgi:hypothetical protein
MIALFIFVLLAGIAGITSIPLIYYVVITEDRRVYAVSLSSGVSSAIAADRAIERYGKKRVRLVFMDTTWEDEDNYRFLADLERRWHKRIVWITDGRDPLQVAEQEHIIPNQKIAPCTHRLKIEPFVRYLRTLQQCDYEVTVILGMNATEIHRHEAPRRNYGAIGIGVEYPLMWAPIEIQPFERLKEWGIEPPRMYRMGYTHSNCGGRCVKQGQGDWLRTLTNFPERFDEVEQWETNQRRDPVLADYALLRDSRGGVVRGMPLSELRQRKEDKQAVQPGLFDDTNCFCNAGDPGDLCQIA